MKAAGVIVEYNPFHNGHAYHLQETKKLTNADITIAVMSGHFLQRGEPALVSKWARTKMALEGGIDLIIELPYAFATQKAQTFASGAVSLLDALGVQEVCFGSESGNIDSFLDTLFLQEQFTDTFEHNVRQRMKEGSSYPKALSEAFGALQGEAHTVDMAKPNNILGFHYIQAIHRQQSSIVPITVTRLNAQYHDETFASATIASATSIRKQLLSSSISFPTIEGVVPAVTYQHLKDYYAQYRLLHNWEHYFSFLKYRLLSSSASQLQHIYEAEEGLENRLLSHIQEANSFHSFMESIKTKRYTWTRLQRLCLHILTNTTKEEMRSINEKETAPYIRILGMSKKGQLYLSSIKKHVPVPIITRLQALDHPLLQLDKKASAVYSAVFEEPLRSKMLKVEMTHPPLRYDEDTNMFL
ncbi:nucleotidyltransferase [Bacillus sp. 165]|uniref:nucleotidyltransferase n=1 Tax=Bacillus sp. 165 TaxID=1529117 RepID=UPI001ADA46D9|nr:nucleotidyltransferase [Bacillus sp. 165]MBO9130279.1 nucleotidyltransferase [Bacillus sp. 165]